MTYCWRGNTLRRTQKFKLMTLGLTMLYYLLTFLIFILCGTSLIRICLTIFPSRMSYWLIAFLWALTPLCGPWTSSNSYSLPMDFPLSVHYPWTLFIFILCGTSLTHVYLIISPSHISYCLSKGFNTSLYAMNKS